MVLNFLSITNFCFLNKVDLTAIIRRLDEYLIIDVSLIKITPMSLLIVEHVNIFLTPLLSIFTLSGVCRFFKIYIDRKGLTKQNVINECLQKKLFYEV